MTSQAPPYTQPWRKIPIPRPLQVLFDTFPLRTYEANGLPERAEHLTTSDLPTLYLFCTEEDARTGFPSYNPGCLKWQTLLRLAKIPFRTLPSTNHASPSGSLPFLLPPRTSSTSLTTPIPASHIPQYITEHSPPEHVLPSLPTPKNGPLRPEAYLPLLTLHLRNAWLAALYLTPAYSSLLEKLYLLPSSSNSLVRSSLKRQLRLAATEEIVSSLGRGTSGVAGEALEKMVEFEEIWHDAKQAMEGLCQVLRESEEGWFFGSEVPSEFDAAVFGYTQVMVEFMSSDSSFSSKKPEEVSQGDGKVLLGEMVKQAGNGELARHRERILARAWPEWDGKREW